MITLKQINTTLERIGAQERLVRGNGYFYFQGGDSESWYSSSVMVNTLNQLTIEQWILERNNLANDCYK